MPKDSNTKITTTTNSNTGFNISTLGDTTISLADNSCSNLIFSDSSASVIANQSTYIDTSGGSMFFNYGDSNIKLSDTINLETRSSNLIIVKNSNLVITWNDELECWDTLQVKKFKGEFKDYKEKETKIKEDSKSTISTPDGRLHLSHSISNTSLIDSLIGIDGNIYIDLRDKKIYEFSDEDEKWSRKEFDKFELKAYKKAKKGELKKRKKQTLLTEKVRNIEVSYIPNYKNDLFTGGFNLRAGNGVIVDGTNNYNNGTHLLNVQGNTNYTNYTINTDVTSTSNIILGNNNTVTY